MSKTIKLSPETLQLLKTFSTINNSLSFKVGSELKTLNEGGTVICSATVTESFPIDFNVYELNRLLSIFSLPVFKDSELVFEDGIDSYMTIKSTSSPANVKYFFTSADFAKHPGKTITLPSADVEFVLTQDVLDNFQKTAAVLGHKTIKINVKDKQLLLIASADGVDSSNDFTLSMGEVNAEDFDAKIKLENLKLVPGDFNVQLLKRGGRGISKFEHTERKITTFIALEIDA